MVKTHKEGAKLYFLEYLKMLQEKYDVTNSEILLELSDSGNTISKSNLSHKLSGDRALSNNELNAIIRVISPSVAEEEQLRTLYKIYLFGERKYDEVLLINEYIEEFDDETTVLFTYKPIELTEIADISDEKLLADVVFSILSDVWTKGKIKIFCQPEYKKMIDSLIYLSGISNSAVEHIVCFNNDYKADSNIYNIKCLKTLDKLVIKNHSHHIKYYYDKINSRANSFSIYPFFIIAGQYALLISYDFKIGYLIKENRFINCLSNEFDRIFSSSQELFSLIDSDLDYLKLCSELENGVRNRFYTLQYYPCLIFNGNEDITRNCIKDSFEYKDNVITLIKKRWETLDNVKGYHLYHPLGMEEFLKTGLTIDMSGSIFKPVSLENRELLIKMIRKHHNQMIYEINKSFLHIPKGLSMVCYDSGIVLISYKINNSNEARLVIKERSIYKSMLNFFEYICGNEIQTQ